MPPPETTDQVDPNADFYTAAIRALRADAAAKGENPNKLTSVELMKRFGQAMERNGFGGATQQAHSLAFQQHAQRALGEPVFNPLGSASERNYAADLWRAGGVGLGEVGAGLTGDATMHQELRQGAELLAEGRGAKARFGLGAAELGGGLLPAVAAGVLTGGAAAGVGAAPAASAFAGLLGSSLPMNYAQAQNKYADLLAEGYSQNQAQNVAAAEMGANTLLDVALPGAGRVMRGGLGKLPGLGGVLSTNIAEGITKHPGLATIGENALNAMGRVGAEGAIEAGVLGTPMPGFGQYMEAGGMGALGGGLALAGHGMARGLAGQIEGWLKTRTPTGDVVAMEPRAQPPIQPPPVQPFIPPEVPRAEALRSDPRLVPGEGQAAQAGQEAGRYDVQRPPEARPEASHRQIGEVAAPRQLAPDAQAEIAKLPPEVQAALQPAIAERLTMARADPAGDLGNVMMLLESKAVRKAIAESRAATKPAEPAQSPVPASEAPPLAGKMEAQGAKQAAGSAVTEPAAKTAPEVVKTEVPKAEPTKPVEPPTPVERRMLEAPAAAEVAAEPPALIAKRRLIEQVAAARGQPLALATKTVEAANERGMFSPTVVEIGGKSEPAVMAAKPFRGAETRYVVHGAAGETFAVVKDSAGKWRYLDGEGHTVAKREQAQPYHDVLTTQTKLAELEGRGERPAVVGKAGEAVAEGLRTKERTTELTPEGKVRSAAQVRAEEAQRAREAEAKLKAEAESEPPPEPEAKARIAEPTPTPTELPLDELKARVPGGSVTRNPDGSITLVGKRGAEVRLSTREGLSVDAASAVAEVRTKDGKLVGEIGFKDGEATLLNTDHEMVHTMRDLGLLKPGEWAALKNALVTDADVVRTKALYEKEGVKLTTEQAAEEVIAEKIAQQHAVLVAHPLWQKIKDFVHDLAVALGLREPATGERVARQIARGEVFAREPRPVRDFAERFAIREVADTPETLVRVAEDADTPTKGVLSNFSSASRTKAGEVLSSVRTKMTPRGWAAATGDRNAMKAVDIGQATNDLSREAQVKAAPALKALDQLKNFDKVMEWQIQATLEARSRVLDKDTRPITLDTVFTAADGKTKIKLDPTEQKAVDGWREASKQLARSTADAIDALPPEHRTPEMSEISKMIREDLLKEQTPYMPMSRQGGHRVVLTSEVAPKDMAAWVEHRRNLKDLTPAQKSLVDHLLVSLRSQAASDATTSTLYLGDAGAFEKSKRGALVHDEQVGEAKWLADFTETPFNRIQQLAPDAKFDARYEAIPGVHTLLKIFSKAGITGPAAEGMLDAIMFSGRRVAYNAQLLVPGFRVAEAKRAIAGYVQSSTTYAAHLQQMPKLNAAIAEVSSPAYRKYLSEWQQAMLAPSPVGARARTWIALAAMSANPSGYLVQAMQTQVQGPAFLAANGVPGAAKLFAEGFKAHAGALWSMVTLKRGADYLGSAVDSYKTSDPALHAYLAEQAATGRYGTDLSRDLQFSSSKLERVLSNSMVFTSRAEIASRLATDVAMWKVAKNLPGEKLAELTTVLEKHGYATDGSRAGFVKAVGEMVNPRVDKGNTPLFALQSGTGAAATSLFSWTQRSVEATINTMRVAGLDRKHAFQASAVGLALVGMLGPQAIPLLGTLGGSAFINMVKNWVTDDPDPRDVATRAGDPDEWFARWLSAGSLGLGIEQATGDTTLSRTVDSFIERVGYTALFKNGANPSDWMPLLSVPMQMGSHAGQAWADVRMGEYGQAGLDALKVFGPGVRNLVTGGQMLASGQGTTAGGEPLTEVSAPEAVGKIAGFQPGSMIEARSQRGSMIEIQQDRTQRLGRYAEAAARAILREDDDGFATIMARLERDNERWYAVGGAKMGAGVIDSTNLRDAIERRILNRLYGKASWQGLKGVPTQLRPLFMEYLTD
jgi:hypothetical protein